MGFELKHLRGRAAVVALFFTTCHVACPITVQALSDIGRGLPPQSPIAIVLVTLDPRTDTPAHLAQWRQERSLSSRFLLLRGSDAATRAFADATGIVFRREPARLVHVPAIVVVDPSGQVREKFLGLQVDAGKIVQAALRAQGAWGPVAAAP